MNSFQIFVAIRGYRAFLALGTFLLMLGAPVSAQQTKKIPQIVYLSLSAGRFVNGVRFEAFRQALHELGYVEGKNIVIEWRNAGGKLNRLSTLAAELVRLKVDVIVTSGSVNTRAAKEATATIPIVMAQDPDPIGNGFVTSLARPGGNITGLSNGLERSGRGAAPEPLRRQPRTLR